MFDPFKIHLRICQPTGSAAAATADASHAKGRASGGKGPASQGQEIRLVVPAIGVVMDSREFEVLTDVISNVGMAQVSICYCHLAPHTQPSPTLTPFPPPH